MFCPVCKAEYRLGFTHCPDCDVDLVHSLDAVHTNAIPPEKLDEPALLWTGTSGEAQAALCTALDAANIPYTQQQRDVGILPGLAQPVYAICVKGRDLDGAHLVLERVAEHFEPDDSDSADDAPVRAKDALDTEDHEDSTLVPDDIPDNFNPENATAQVWSGSDSDMAEMVRICLRENGIGCVVEDVSNEKAVPVTPESEARAREIVREIVSGTPSA